MFRKASELASSIHTGFIIYSLVKHKIAEALLESPKTIEELVHGTDLNPDRLHRVLLIVEERGYFSFDSESKKWSNNPESLALADPVFSLLTSYFLHPFRTESLPNLDKLLTSDKSSFELRGFENYFAAVQTVPGLLEEFQKAMQVFTLTFSKEVIQNLDLSESKKVLDVGGGNGSLVANLALKYPIDFGVFESPKVVELAAKNIEEKGLSERIKVHAGNFFESIPEGYDSILMKFVLHDWSDENCIKILKNSRNALQPGQKIFIVETLIDKNSSFYNMQLNLDFNMMQIHGSKERRLDEFEALFDASGFKLEKYSESSYCSVIQAIAV